MLINFSQKLLNLDKTPVVDEKGRELSLGRACANAMTFPRQGRSADTIKCYILATKIYDAAEIEIDQADIELIKEELKSGQYGPLVAGQATLLLTPAPQSTPDKK